MFDRLRGKLIENQVSYIVIDVNGVGYKVLIAPTTIPFSLHQECTLFTSFVVRENFQAIYGFANAPSRDLFETLIQISGVGPKTALCILSQFSPERFKEAVLTENIKLLSSVPGLGKKTVEKIILDLKDKLPKMIFLGPHHEQPHNRQHLDAIGALVNLGFSDRAAAKAIEKATENGAKQMELSEMITEALRNR